MPSLPIDNNKKDAHQAANAGNNKYSAYRPSAVIRRADLVP